MKKVNYAHSMKWPVFTFLSPLLCLLLLAACSEGVLKGDDGGLTDGGDASHLDGSALASIQFRFNLEGSEFYDTPWPSDHRLNAEGSPELKNFPNADHPFVAANIAEIERDVRGFSQMPVVYLALASDPGDVGLLKPKASLREDGPVQLIALGDDCESRVAVEVVVRATDDEFLPANYVAVSPIVGFALKAATQYALVVLKSFGKGKHRTGTLAPANFIEALAGTGKHRAYNDSLAPLTKCLDKAKLKADDIAIATVFTTQDSQTEMRKLIADVENTERVKTPELENWTQIPESQYPSKTGEYTSYTASVKFPIYQSGDSPYTVGGGFRFDEAGKPIVQRWEDVPVIFTIPVGDGPFPVFIWQSGAGASLKGHTKQAFLKTLFEGDIAVAKFLPQFHGDRNVPGGDLDLHSYNYLNPESARAVLRQQAIDGAYMVRVVREALAKREEANVLDMNRLAMGGHSQGAEVAAMLASSTAQVDAYLLSGVGTYVSETIVHRTNPFDVAELLGNLLGIKGPIDRFHSLIQLAQLEADVVDPNNYLKDWKGWSGKPSGVHVMAVDGFNDQDVYFTSMNAMVIGGDLALIDPPGWDVDPFGVWGRNPEALPISANREATDGSKLTMAAFLDPKLDHYVLWDSEVARQLVLGYLQTALSGVPTVSEISTTTP
jgi:predicted esterase